MGIQYSGGRLPFLIFDEGMGQSDVPSEIEDLYCDHEAEFQKLNKTKKGFHSAQFPFKHGWMIKHDGPTIDDISMRSTFNKGEHEVYFSSLNDADDYFFAAKDKAALEAFVNDFGVNGEILKDEKVVQAG